MRHLARQPFCHRLRGRLGSGPARARQHSLHVADAQALRHLAAQQAKPGVCHPRQARQPRLPARQQAIGRLLPDLLGRRPRAHNALAQSARQGRPHAARQHQAPANQAACKHRRQRLAHRRGNHTGVLQRRRRLARHAFGLLELALRLFGGLGVPVVGDFLGLFEAQAQPFGGVPGMPARHHVRQAHSYFRHSDGGLDRRGPDVLRPALQAPLWRRRIRQKAADFRFGLRRTGRRRG